MSTRTVAAAALLVLAGATAAACDDAGTTARRALAECFVDRSAAERGGPAAGGAERESLLAGRDWDAGLVAAARERGGLRWQARVTYEAHGPEGRTARLEVTAALDLRADGAFRVRLDQRATTPEGRESASGREALWLDRLLYTRLANGPFFVRQSLDREHEAWRAAPVEAVGELVRALGPLVSVVPAAPGDARRYRLGPGPGPPAVATDPAERRTLRERDATWPLWLAALYRAEQATGELTLAADGRSVERARLSFAGAARDGEAERRLAVAAEAALEPLPPDAAAWTPPADARAPTRERTHARIERILAPFRAEPTRKQPAPDQPAAAAGID